jgi:hypothetical protein
MYLPCQPNWFFFLKHFSYFSSPQIIQHTHTHKKLNFLQFFSIGPFLSFASRFSRVDEEKFVIQVIFIYSKNSCEKLAESKAKKRTV